MSERGLRDGDVVAIGTARLVFRADLPDSASGKVVLHPSAVPLRCQACGADYRRGDAFCRECGCRSRSRADRRRPSAAHAARRSRCRHDSVPAAASRWPAAATSRRRASSVLEAVPAGPAVGGVDGDRDRTPRHARRTRGARARRARSSRIRTGAGAARRLTPAEPGSRLAAALIDAVFIGSGQLALLAPVFWYWWDREVPRSAADVPFLPVLASVTLVPLALLLGALYHVYFWSAKGATPGKELLDLQVQCDDGSPIGVGRAVLRVAGYFSRRRQPRRRLPDDRVRRLRAARPDRPHPGRQGEPMIGVEPRDRRRAPAELPLAPGARGSAGRVPARRVWRAVWEFLHDLSIAVLFCFFLITFVVQAFRVQGTSMLPLLDDGERIVVNKFVYRFQPDRARRRRRLLVPARPLGLVHQAGGGRCPGTWSRSAPGGSS